MKKSRSNLAKDAGVTESYIAKLENGVITNPTLVVLKGLSKALNVSPLEFFKWKKGCNVYHGKTNN